MKMKVPLMVSTRTKPISRPLRSPMKTSSTTITMATAWIRLSRKLSMATVTASDCSETIPSSTPSGIRGSSSRMR